MLRVTTLYASSAAATAKYYTKYLTQAPGEQPGVWAGAQAAGGLAGEVSTDALRALVVGSRPDERGDTGLPVARSTRANGTSFAPWRGLMRRCRRRSRCRCGGR